MISIQRDLQVSNFKPLGRITKLIARGEAALTEWLGRRIRKLSASETDDHDLLGQVYNDLLGLSPEYKLFLGTSSRISWRTTMPESQSPTQPGPGPNLDIDASVEISTRRGEDRIDVI